MKQLYCKGRANTDRESNSPLEINNCGFYRGVPRDWTTCRPKGRKDYLFIFVVRGSVACGDAAAEDGDGYLFFPDVPQRFTYRAGDDTHYNWIHFTGNDVPALIEKAGLTGGILHHGKNARRIGELFRMIFASYSDGVSYADAYAEGLLRAILAIAGASDDTPNPFHRVLQLMSDPTDTHTVSDYAVMCMMSEAHFIRSFKTATGLPPLAFRTRQRILLAKEMLEDTSASIGDIGAVCGFPDPLYFSRVFRKEAGISPREYRRRFASGQP